MKVLPNYFKYENFGIFMLTVKLKILMFKPEQTIHSLMLHLSSYSTYQLIFPESTYIPLQHYTLLHILWSNMEM